jgi:hypothetical protein
VDEEIRGRYMTQKEIRVGILEELLQNCFDKTFRWSSVISKTV